MIVPWPQSPSLLCFNLRREHVGALDREAAPTLSNVAWMLERARADGWRVQHAYTTRLRQPGLDHGAFGALAPLAEEPVYALASASAFSEPALADIGRTRRPACLHLIGALYSRAGLASVLMAQELGLSLNIVAEACFAPEVEPVAPARVLDLVRGDRNGGVRIVGGPAQRAQGENVVCLGTWRT